MSKNITIRIEGDVASGKTVMLSRIVQMLNNDQHVEVAVKLELNGKEVRGTTARHHEKMVKTGTDFEGNKAYPRKVTLVEVT